MSQEREALEEKGTDYNDEQKIKKNNEKTKKKEKMEKKNEKKKKRPIIKYQI